MKFRRLVLLMAGLFVATGAAADGVFVSVGLPNVSIDGKFDGQAIFSGGGSSEIVPKFEASNGIAFVVGLKQEHMMMSASYMQADLDGTWRGSDVPADFWALTGELAYVFRPDKRMQPYLLGGMGISAVTVKDGSTDGSRFADAKFATGLQWRIGGGMMINLSNRFNIDLQAVKLLGEYDQLDGIAAGSLKDFSSDGTILTVGLQYSFGGHSSQ